MDIRLQMQSHRFIRQLGKKAGQLQIVAADTLNESAEEVEKNYQRRLVKNAKLRGKFSLNSIKIFKSKPFSRSGEPRPLHKMNAVVGVKKMKGGKEHYLAKLEQGGTTRGNRRTLGRVPVPLASSRVSGNDNRVVSRVNRITTAPTQILKAGGRKFGVKGDRRANGRRWKNPRQRFAALHTYKNKEKGNSRGVTGDLKKPFYFMDNKGKQGIFKFKGRRLQKLRTLEKTSVRRKPEPHFKKAVKLMTPTAIQRKFVKKAQRKLGR